LLRRPLDSRLDAALARQVALQDGGIRALVAGRVHKADSTYVITVDVVRPSDGAAIGQLTEQSPKVSEIMAAVRRATLTLRERLGEPAESVARSRQALQRTPPPSLAALRLYAQAAAKAHSTRSTPTSTGMPYQGAEWAVVERLARGAVAADQRFARARVLLSDAIRRQRGPLDQTQVTERRADLEKAVEFIDYATPRERYVIESRLHEHRAYENGIRGNVAERRELNLSLDATQALLLVQPDDDEMSEIALMALTDLARARLGPEFGRAMTSMTIQAADARPKNVGLNLTVANIYLSQARFDAARTYAARAESAIAAATPAQAATIRRFPASIAWLQNDAAEALRTADREVGAAKGLNEEERGNVSVAFVPLYFALGRARQAEQIINGFPGRRIARSLFLSNMGDKVRLQQMVAEWPDPGPREEGALMFRIGSFIETNNLEEAERDLITLDRVVSKRGNAGFQSQSFDYHGALELARGRPDVAIGLLRKSIEIKRKQLPGLASIPGQYAIAILVKALESTGQLDEAIALLLEGGETRGEVAALGTFDGWMLHRAHLARLYRKKGQIREAEAVEAHLLKLLAVADPDFPLLRELRSRSN
jgi:tetratricopeptide (TPR) repeat protein